MIRCFPGAVTATSLKGLVLIDNAVPVAARCRELRNQLDPDGRGLSPWLRKLLLPE